MHYAARFGRLDEIEGGVTVAQLARVKSDTDWDYQRDAATGNYYRQAFTCLSALMAATRYGHLDQITDTVTLAKLGADEDPDGRTALGELMAMIREGEDPIDLGNNLCACPEILKHLSPGNPIHVAAVRHAIGRNRTLETLLGPEMMAALL